MSTSVLRKDSHRVSSTARRKALAAAIELEGILTMVACSNCVRSGDFCYFLKERSQKCSCCIRKNAECDGSFSLAELRRVGEQKKVLKSKSRAKRREISRLRQKRVLAYGALLEAQQELAKIDADIAKEEDDDIAFTDDLSRLEEKSSLMLRREMQALGALDEVSEGEEIALAEPEAWPPADPAISSQEWDFLLKGSVTRYAPLFLLSYSF